MRVGRPLIAMVPIWAQPTALALLLALVAWPLVVLTWDVGLRGNYISSGAPVSSLPQWVSAAGGVFLSALVAGSIGGLIVRRGARIGGMLFTFALALAVAIIGATLLPVLFGQENTCFAVSAAGIVSPCDFITNVVRTTVEMLQALPLYLLFAPFVEPVAVLTLALGVGLWSTVLTRLYRSERAMVYNK
jgi:hypothetical protein